MVTTMMATELRKTGSGHEAYHYSSLVRDRLCEVDVATCEKTDGVATGYGNTHLLEHNYC
jgi:hypothetical protein